MSGIGTLPFNSIPATQRSPLFFVEFNSSLANTALALQRTLIIGQMLAAGTATPSLPVQVVSIADGKGKFGTGSMLAAMIWAYYQNDPNGTIYALPCSDDGAAVKAAGSLNFTAVATAVGVLSLYIAGQLISMAVTTSQTTAQLATALAAAINANTDLPVTAAVDGIITSKVNITANNGGLAGNDIDIRVNYLGSAGGQALPTGMTVAIVAMATGATNPVLTTPLANCAAMPFDFICNPYNDTTSLNSLQTFLNAVTGRWAYNIKIYGHAFNAYRGTVSALTTLGLTRNDPHNSILGFYDSPSPNWNWAAAYMGACAVALRADPGRPMQTLVLNGLLPAPQASLFTSPQSEGLLFAGISTFTVNAASQISLAKIITTYQLNAFSQTDNSYLGIEVPFQLMFLMRDLESYITTRYWQGLARVWRRALAW